MVVEENKLIKLINFISLKLFLSNMLRPKEIARPIAIKIKISKESGLNIRFLAETFKDNNVEIFLSELNSRSLS